MKPGPGPAIAIAIVGGGWAGLAAGVELAAAGRRVELFESARQLGGRARSVDWNGISIDNGQHLMIGAYRQTQTLIERLGTTTLLERRRLELTGTEFRMSLPKLPAPLHLAAGLINARGLSPGDKMAAFRFMRSLGKSGFKLPQDTAVTELLAAYRQPSRLVERLWEPICIAALNTPLTMASGQVFCNVLRDSLAGARQDSDLLFNRAALGRLLPEAAQRFLNEHGGTVRLSSRVEGLRLEQDRIRLIGPDLLADRVIIATHPGRVPALVSGIEALADTVDRIRRFTWQPIHTTWLHFATPLEFPFPMLALGHGMAPWAFERNDLAPGLVSIVTSAEGPHLTQAPEALQNEMIQRLATRLGPLPPLRAWKTIIEKRATFACTVGLERPGNATAVSSLYLAGDYTAGDYPATLEGAVSSGLECARTLLETNHGNNLTLLS